MNRYGNFFWMFSIFLIFLVSVFTRAEEEETVYRIALLVGSSRGLNLPPLVNTREEVESLAEIFQQYSHVAHTLVLIDPAKNELAQSFDTLQQILKTVPEYNQVQFIFYYYGHGLPEGLLLGNEIFSKDALKNRLEQLTADIKIVFLDSCSSQIMGEKINPDFETDAKGIVYITSSSLFQKAYAGVFSPLLKTALMGAADGFIPEQFESNFLYHELLQKSAREDKDFLIRLFGFKSTLTLVSGLEQTQQREIDRTLHALGFKEVPAQFGFTDFQEKALNRIENIHTRTRLEEAYEYQDVYLKPNQLTNDDAEQLKRILENRGFKEDRFITMSELFCYIHTKTAENRNNFQSPTINMRNLESNTPVKLAFVNHKTPLLLQKWGAITLYKILDNRLMKNIFQWPQDLGTEDPVTVFLPNGRYRLLIETAQARYAVEVVIDGRTKIAEPPGPAWDNLVSYKEIAIKNGITTEHWLDIKDLEKKLKADITGRNISTTFLITSFGVPLSLFTTGFYFNYRADTLYAGYRSESGSDRLIQLRSEIERNTRLRDNFYLAGGICLAIPVVPLVFRIVYQLSYEKGSRQLDEIKKRIKQDERFTGAFFVLPGRSGPFFCCTLRY